MASSVPLRDPCICAICKDDISMTLGRRRILFHFIEGKDPINEVVREFGTIFEVFSGRKCSLTSTNVLPNHIDNASSKWCCRKCERQVNCMYKRFEEVCQWYTQYRECPLANILANCEGSDDRDTVSCNENVGDEITAFETDNGTEEIQNKDSESNKTNKFDIIMNDLKKRKCKSSPESTKKLKKPKYKRENDDSNDIIIDEPKLTETDDRIITMIKKNNYDGVMRVMLSDEKLKTTALTEVAKYISRECTAAGCEIAKLSHDLQHLKIPDYKKSIVEHCPFTIQFLCSLIGKDKLLKPPIITIISLLMYAINSHANLFQKIISILLLHAKCNPSTIEKLHTYKICIAYETLVTFLDNNTELGEVPKLVRTFQLT